MSSPTRQRSGRLAAVLAAGAVAAATAAPGSALAAPVRAVRTLYAYPGSGATASGSGCPVTADVAMQCDVTQAVARANSGDTVKLARSGTYRANLRVVVGPLTITAVPGAAAAIHGTTGPVIDDTGPGPLTISGLEITGGAGSNGTGILDQSGSTLTVLDSTIDHNSNAGGSGGGIWNDSPAGELDVIASTVAGNSSHGAGGGIFNSTGAHTKVIDSTIYGNRSIVGGGVYNPARGTLRLLESTVVDNRASQVAGPGGGGIFNAGVLDTAGSIVARNSGRDCAGGVTDGGYDIDSDGSCHLPASTSISASSAIDDYLSALGGYGGPTRTVVLLRTPSPATSQPDPALLAIPSSAFGDHVPLCKINGAEDQRGFPRLAPGATACDIGAIEQQPGPVPMLAESPSPLLLLIPAFLVGGGWLAYRRRRGAHVVVAPAPSGDTSTR